VTQAFPPEGQFLEVDGERIHYRSIGAGPALVLVHGLGGQMRNFEYLPLAQLAQRWRVILVDRPGSGRSPRADEGKAGIAAQGRSSRSSSARWPCRSRRCWWPTRWAAPSPCRPPCRIRRPSPASRSLRP
jgi:pimeloyl-ACP methyl ester carboxylesterase